MSALFLDKLRSLFLEIELTDSEACMLPEEDVSFSLVAELALLEVSLLAPEDVELFEEPVVP